MYWLNFLMPLVFDILRGYINSTSSKKDDEVLKIVQDGARYLSNKDNNNVTDYEASLLEDKRVK